MMGAPNLLAESMEYGLSYSVASYLKKLSQQVLPQNITESKFMSFCSLIYFIKAACCVSLTSVLGCVCVLDKGGGRACLCISR